MVYINLKIIKKHNEIIEKGFIRVKNGLINEIGLMENFVEHDEEVLNCEGLKVVPGFVDAHCHVGMWENGLSFEGADGNEETDPVCSHLRAIDGINPADDAFVDALRAGVTTIVTGPGSANPIGGTFAAIKTCGNCVDEMLIEQSVGMKFALGENPKNVYNEKAQFPTTRMAVASIIRENLEKAKRYLERARLAKSDLSMDEPDYDIKLEALRPVLERRIKAFFHCHRADDICTAIRIAKEFNLDLVLVHATEAILVEKHVKGFNLIVGPLICDRLKPELKNHTVKGVAELFKKCHSIAICSDHPVVPVNYLVQTCAVLRRYGVSEMEILKLITQKAAEICGIFNKVGSLEEAKCANFVAFKENDDIFLMRVEPQFVVVDGNVVVKSNV